MKSKDRQTYFRHVMLHVIEFGEDHAVYGRVVWTEFLL